MRSAEASMAYFDARRAYGAVWVSAGVGWLAAAGCASGSTFSADVPLPPQITEDAGSNPLLPVLGPTVSAANAPPPISGGTLLVTHDGSRAVAADPDRDQVYVVDLGAKQLASTVALQPGDEPGRVAEDGAGRVHVALRGGGALVTIDPAQGVILARRPACAAPRGVAWDASTDLVWVACATGELVALPAAGGAAVHSFLLERDLRDVVVSQGGLAVTTFRSARLLRVSREGGVARTDGLPSPIAATPHVAWRAIGGPADTVIAVHQAHSTQSLATQVQGGYGSGACSGFSGFSGPASSAGSTSASGAPTSTAGASGDDTTAAGDGGVGARASSCLPGGPGPGWTGLAPNLNEAPLCGPSAVAGVLTVLDAHGSPLVNVSFPAVLPVDVAISPDGSTMAAVAPGNASQPGLDTVFLFDGCGRGLPSGQIALPVETTAPVTSTFDPAPIALTFDPANDLLVQTREPARLVVLSPSGSNVVVSLSGISRRDTGHDIFHTQAGAMIACASCHPEGRDDGHIWMLDGQARRSPSLLGTVAGTAPYHWPGDEPTLDVLVDDVYTKRMSGAPLDKDQKGVLERWVQALPAPPAPAPDDPAAAARGQALFQRADVGCASCHSGPKFTNNATVDVGTGGAFQVPPLVGVAWRTPLLHAGCAATLEDRFGLCSTPGHGSLYGLSLGDVSDLVAYLATL
ncbi:MAG TPA: cytochrome-c peroxidase [Polyangiaceae bacterium]|nr:cytochrome-c peroxidase [Polyangiaceae bacterium]